MNREERIRPWDAGGGCVPTTGRPGLLEQAVDPFDRAHAVKLHGEWEGYRRAKKGVWRVIFLPPEEGTIYVVYIR